MVGRRFWWFWQIPNICIPENISTRVDDAMVGAGSFRSYVRRHWICSRRPCGSKCPVGSCRMSTGWCHSYPAADPGWENWSNRTAWRKTGWKRNILWDLICTFNRISNLSELNNYFWNKKEHHHQFYPISENRYWYELRIPW